MTGKLMYFSNYGNKITPSIQLQLMVEHLDTQINEPANQTSINVPKVVKLTNKKRLLYDFRD